MVADQLNISTLIHLNVTTLHALKKVLLRLSTPLYTSVNSKGRASVGQHVRHLLEFYQCLFEATTTVNYDNRKRNLKLETDLKYAIKTIDSVVAALELQTTDRPLHTLANFPSATSQPLCICSSLSRELLYVLEHAIHHKALLRILIKDANPQFELDDAFGVAYSTMAYQNQQAGG